MNRVILIGNLGKDPEIRSLNSGDRVCNFSLATSERWTDKQSGERKEKTEWHAVVIFNQNVVKIAEQYLRKGNKVMVEGQLQTRKWQDQQGHDRWSTEVVLKQWGGQLELLTPKAPMGEERDNQSPEERGREIAERETQRQANRGNGSYKADLDDDIPF
jgi:single-strand DNA-binding protein